MLMRHGCTPNPCIDCNRYLKFDKMFQRMRELEYDYIVTGHYARVEYDEERGRYLLKKAVDDTKDQSYVLYMLYTGAAGTYFSAIRWTAKNRGA